MHMMMIKAIAFLRSIYRSIGLNRSMDFKINSHGFEYKTETGMCGYNQNNANLD